jgi:hypothetical protein
MVILGLLVTQCKQQNHVSSVSWSRVHVPDTQPACPSCNSHVGCCELGSTLGRALRALPSESLLYTPMNSPFRPPPLTSGTAVPRLESLPAAIILSWASSRGEVRAPGITARGEDGGARPPLRATAQAQPTANSSVQGAHSEKDTGMTPMVKRPCAELSGLWVHVIFNPCNLESCSIWCR